MKILDQVGREIELNEKPSRVVSLVPSITELAFDLGFDVIGKTKFCIHPSGETKARIVGGTKNVNIDLIRELQPDLVLANKEENTKRTVDRLLASDIPVYVSEVSDVKSSLDLIHSMGSLGGFERKASELIKEIKSGFSALASSEKSISALYFIWQEPYMVAGTDTYISDVLAHLGIRNAISDWGNKGKRYPKISSEEIKKLNPDVLLLSSEPYPFGEKHVKGMSETFSSYVRLVDGESFSWYGSRQVKSISYLRKFSRLLSVDGEK